MRLRLLARADQLVELATLGAYGVADDGALLTLDPSPGPVAASRLRDGCPDTTPSTGCVETRLRPGGECSASPAGCRNSDPPA